MTIQVTCDNCGKVVKAKDEYAGKKGKCPGCGRIVLMPAQKIVHAEPDESQFPWQNESVPAQNSRHTAGGSTASPPRASTPLRETRDSSPEPPSRQKTTPEVRPGDATATKTCPACAEVIKAVATKCRYCGEVLVAANDEPSTQPPAFPEFRTDTGFASAQQTVSRFGLSTDGRQLAALGGGSALILCLVLWFALSITSPGGSGGAFVDLVGKSPILDAETNQVLEAIAAPAAQCIKDISTHNDLMAKDAEQRMEDHCRTYIGKQVSFIATVERINYGRVDFESTVVSKKGDPEINMFLSVYPDGPTKAEDSEGWYDHFLNKYYNNKPPTDQRFRDFPSDFLVIGQEISADEAKKLKAGDKLKVTGVIGGISVSGGLEVNIIPSSGGGSFHICVVDCKLIK